jgi:glycosyltransferase involved in cell wall biosynthesis
MLTNLETTSSEVDDLPVEPPRHEGPGSTSLKPIRVCIVAEHASYRFGGEAVLPVHFFAGLRARGIEAWLVVHSRTSEELLAAFPDDQERLRFIPDAWFHKLLLRLSIFLPRRIAQSTTGLVSQLTTQYLARKIVRDLVAGASIDIVHQPIPVSPRFPSLMSGLGVPVVIGPMNGGMEYPAAFRQRESFLTRAAVNIGRHLSDFVNSQLSGKKLAEVLLVANQRTRLALPSGVRGQVIELPENGVHIGTWSSSSTKSPTDLGASAKCRFVFMGRLVDWKGVDMAIEAISRVPNAELVIIGDGPMREPWRKAAEDLHISDRVTFTGWLPQDECAPHIHSSLALVLPSIYECGGAVVLEAMASGTPVIATNWGGPADYLDGSCGFLIDPRSREAIVEGFAAAMQQLIDHPEQRDQLGAKGKQRVLEHFDWEKKIDRVLEIYRDVLATKNGRVGN